MLPARGVLSRALLALSAAACALPAAAADPSVTILTEQCDGTYASGASTRRPNPGVRAELQSATGLKIGQRRLSIHPSTTRALWRFDGDYQVQISSCFTTGCSVGAGCRTWTYLYVSTLGNTSATLETGKCTYRDPGNTSCASLTQLYAGADNQAPVQIAASCPASTTTLAQVSGSSFAVAAAGPLAGEASLGLSSSALSLNGSSQFARTPDSVSWDLPASYTLAAWIRTGTANGRIVSQENGLKGWGIAVSTGGRLRHLDSRDASVTTSSDVALPASSPNIADNAWHLVHVVRINGSARRFYVDGVFVASVTAASTSSFATHPVLSPLDIGRRNNGSEFFNGSLDDIRILQSALDDDDVFMEWNTTIHKHSTDSGVTFSTVAGSYSGSPSNGTTAAVTYIPGEAYAANRRWRFLAANVNASVAQTAIVSPSIDTSPPTPAPLNGAASGATSILWSWGAPLKVCSPPGSPTVEYRLVDAPSGSVLIPPGAMAYPATSVTETLAGGPNQLVGRRLRLDDVWGNSLSASASVYTLSNPAGAVSFAAVSTVSVRLEWTLNGNPAYTRWGANFSTDPTFATAVTTLAAVNDNFLGSSFTINGLTPGTTYHGRVQSFSGRAEDLFGGATSAFLTAFIVTNPSAPTLGGLPLGVSSVSWTWSLRQGATQYKLFDAGGTTLTPAGFGALTLAQTGLAANTQYTASVEAVSIFGAGPRASASVYTLANDPTSPFLSAVHPTSATYVWGANSNPPYTFYELVVSTDATFAVSAATVTVNATTATVTGLLPGTTYHARLRAINGSQIPANFVAVPSTRTVADPTITITQAPPTPYVAGDGIVGQWLFDEGSGLSAADGSGKANAAALTCLAAACASTPTFAAGPDGLGTAVEFVGVNDSLVRVPDTSTYAFTDSITVSAWVRPATANQPSGAGVVTRGSGTFENFSLDSVIVGTARHWRFMPKPGFVAVSSFPIAAGVWTHLLGSYDSAAGTATLYLNGVAYATTTVTAPRLAANHDITIGNRQSASGSYDRGFIGRIDGVRVFRRAYSAAQALSEYQGNFVSTVTPVSPNDLVAIGLPPNAFGAPATIFVTNDPVNHPIKIDAATLNAGLSVAPTGHTLVPGSLFEIVPVVGGLPFTANLGSSATVALPYSDANWDNVVDGTNPPIPASGLKAFTLNTTVNRWEELAIARDPGNRRVVAWTPHFSVFALFGPHSIGSSLEGIRVYPIPWMPRGGGRFDATGITFDRLPTNGVIRILTAAGERVREFGFSGAAAGSAVWDGRNENGRPVASGVYFARVTAADGSVRVVKLAIER